MSNVVAFAKAIRRTDVEIERVLEAALAEVRAGRLRSLIAVVMDARGQECILVTGAYSRNRGLASNAGFKLQMMANDSSFG